MCGPKFCSLQVSHDIRAAMDKKAQQFKQGGGEIYR